MAFPIRGDVFLPNDTVRDMTTVQEIAAIAQNQAQTLGINKFDIYGATIEETSVQVDHGEPKQVEASNRASITVRVWAESGQVGVTSTTDIDENGLALALKTAQEASAFGVTANAPDFSTQSTAPLGFELNLAGDDTPIPDLLKSLTTAEAKLLESHEAIVSVPYNGLAQRHSNRFYVNSAGAMRQENRASSSVYLYSKTEQEGKKPRSSGAFRVSNQFEQLDIAGCVAETAEKTISHLDYQGIPSGQYQVVFSPEAFLSLIRAFSNLFNAQNILDKRSLSTPDSLGTAIASDSLNLFDDALHPDNVSKVTFDDEGTPTRRIPLIEKGILTGFIHSSGTAKQMKAEPTGHANMGAKITVSSHYYHVLPGTETKAEFDLATADNVIYIDSLKALHAGVKSLQGSFSLPFEGWLIQTGTRVSIDSATVAGDFMTLLKSIAHIEPDAKVTMNGICPRVWVNDLAITGEQ
jgi:PmbA protein